MSKSLIEKELEMKGVGRIKDNFGYDSGMLFAESDVVSTLKKARKALKKKIVNADVYEDYKPIKNQEVVKWEDIVKVI